MNWLIKIVRDSKFKEKSFLYNIKCLIEEGDKAGDPKLIHAPTYAVLKTHFNQWARVANELMPDSERTKHQLVDMYLKTHGRE